MHRKRESRGCAGSAACGQDPPERGPPRGFLMTSSPFQGSHLTATAPAPGGPSTRPRPAHGVNGLGAGCTTAAGRLSWACRWHAVPAPPPPRGARPKRSGAFPLVPILTVLCPRGTCVHTRPVHSHPPARRPPGHTRPPPPSPPYLTSPISPLPHQPHLPLSTTSSSPPHLSPSPPHLSPFPAHPDPSAPHRSPLQSVAPLLLPLPHPRRPPFIVSCKHTRPFHRGLPACGGGMATPTAFVCAPASAPGWATAPPVRLPLARQRRPSPPLPPSGALPARRRSRRVPYQHHKPLQLPTAVADGNHRQGRAVAADMGGRGAVSDVDGEGDAGGSSSIIVGGGSGDSDGGGPGVRRLALEAEVPAVTGACAPAAKPRAHARRDPEAGGDAGGFPLSSPISPPPPLDHRLLAAALAPLPTSRTPRLQPTFTLAASRSPDTGGPVAIAPRGCIGRSSTGCWAWTRWTRPPARALLTRRPRTRRRRACLPLTWLHRWCPLGGCCPALTAPAGGRWRSASSTPGCSLLRQTLPAPLP